MKTRYYTDTLAIIAVTTIILVIGFIMGMMVERLDTPNCPTEDSCYVDYYDGQWHVIEGER